MLKILCSFAPFSVLLALVFISTGCVDQDAEALKAKRAELSTLLDDIKDYRKYVPVKKKLDYSLSVDKLKAQTENSPAFQSATLEELFENSDLRKQWRDHVDSKRAELEKIADALPPSEQAATYRLLSDMHASAARAAAREYEVTGYKIEFLSSVFISKLSIIDIAHDRALRYSIDSGPLEGQLAEYRNKTQGYVTQLQGQVDQLKQSNTQLESQATENGDAAKKLQMQSDELKTKASLVIDRKERAALIVKAEELRRESYRKDANVQRANIQIIVNNRYLKLLEITLKVRQDELAKITKSDGAAAKEKATLQEQKATAVKTLQTAETELKAGLDNLTTRYKAEVQDKLDEAALDMEKAIELARKANDKSKWKKEHVDIALQPINRQIEHIHILIKHCEAAKGLGMMLANAGAHAKALGLAQATDFETHYKALYDKQLDLISRAGPAIEKAKSAASEVAAAGSPDEQSTAVANNHVEIIDQYKKRFDNSKLPPQPIGKIKPLPSLTAAP